jgi:nitroimidazol reductase NimA-like FMN-containing flavoprotein (pyridoxamine 5'-phosphate oxidase superfamily)
METDRTKIHRAPHKQVYEPAIVRRILERAILAHVAISIDGQPYCLPVACAPYGDELLMHGSTASRLFKTLSEGAPACVTITLVDGLVLARSSFESSMHYESLMAFGSARLLSNVEKRAALQALTDHLFPNRRSELRPSTEKEIKATTVVAFPLNEISIKVSQGQPDDPESDLHAQIWAGILPITRTYGTPIPADNLRVGIDVPEYISGWPINRI